MSFDGRSMGDVLRFDGRFIYGYSTARKPDYVGKVISRIGVLMYLWFAIQGQCVVVIPAALTCTYTIIMNIINH